MLTELSAYDHRPTDRLSWLWLAIGAVLLPFTTIHLGLSLAAWLAPIFLLRFVRTQRAPLGLPIVALASAAALAVAWRDFLPMPIGVGLGMVYGLVFSLGYMADRLLTPRLTGVARTLVFPSAVTAVDWLSSQQSLTASYGSPAYTQYGNLALMQVVSITGIWGLTFLIHWLAPVVNEFWEGPNSRSIRTSVFLFLGVMAAVLLFGSARITLFPPSSPTLQVAAIPASRERYRTVEPPFFALMPGSAAERAAYRAQTAPILDELFARTEQQARAGAKVIAWSEDAAIILKEDEAATVERAANLARREGIYLEIAFLPILQNEGFPAWQNRAVLLDPSGIVLWTYDKSHTTLGPETAFTAPGPGLVATADTAAGRLASVICFDMDFPALIRQAGRAQAGLIIAPSLDWDTAAVSHAQIATFRAIENGVSLLRPAGDGISTAVDHQGRVLASVNSFTGDSAAFVTSVQTQGVPTVYSVIGDAFAYLSVAGLVFLAALSRFQRPRVGEALQKAA